MPDFFAAGANCYVENRRLPKRLVRRHEGAERLAMECYMRKFKLPLIKEMIRVIWLFIRCTCAQRRCVLHILEAYEQQRSENCRAPGRPGVSTWLIWILGLGGVCRKLNGLRLKRRWEK